MSQHRRTRSLWPRLLLGAMGVVVLVAVVITTMGPKQQPPQAATYPWHPGVTASVFSPDEDATADNAFIPNDVSAWDEQWRKNAAHENPYFVALPYADYLENGSFNPDNRRIPWHKANVQGKSELKNRWVQISRTVGDQTRTVYAQWEDVGPSNKTDGAVLSDPDYVFGPKNQPKGQDVTVKPKNTFGLKAGIDLSPRAAKDLGMEGEGKVTWRFVDETDVPAGPWTKTVTTRGPSWS